MTKRSITITGKDRPQLFRRMLASLVTNDLAGWRLVIRIEPGPAAGQFLAIAAELLTAVEHDIAVNEAVLGIRMNPFHAIEAAFAGGSPLNLCLEEDFILAPDAAALALWYERHHRPHWLCLSLLAGPCASAGFLSNQRYPTVLFEAHTFNSIGFALRREEWERHVRGVWKMEGGDRPRGGILDWTRHWGWDWSIYAHLLLNPHLRTVQPAFARATHTGAFGYHTKPEFNARAFGKLPYNLATGIGYRLVEVEELPHELRSHIHLHEEMSDLRLMQYELALKARAAGLAAREEPTRIP
jgi:hypothetical protein